MEIEIAVLVSIDVKAAHDIQLALGYYDPLHSPKAWTLNFGCTTAQSLKNRCFRAILRRFEFQKPPLAFLERAPTFFRMLLGGIERLRYAELPCIGG